MFQKVVKGEPKPGRQKYGFFNYSYFEYLLIMYARATTSFITTTTKKTTHQKCKNVNASSDKRARIINASAARSTKHIDDPLQHTKILRWLEAAHGYRVSPVLRLQNKKRLLH